MRPRPCAWRDPNARAYVEIDRVTKSFGDFKAVDDVSLKIYKGEIFCLLGASGCGKTTLLRMLGGFETPTSGRILIDGEDMTGVPPYERPVNMMFQSYALFPHMNVEQNVAFGLKQDRVPTRRDRRAGRDHARARQARRLREAQAAPALRRPAPAGGARPLARQAAESAAARRAAGRARQEIARAHAVRADRAAGQARRHLPGGDARPGGGHDPGDPHRRHGPRRDRPGGHPLRDLRVSVLEVRRGFRRLGEHLRGQAPRG